MSYSCDPTIDPKLKRPAASRSAGSLTPMSPFSTPGPSTSSVRGRSVSSHAEHGVGSPGASAWMSSALQNALQMGEPDDQGGDHVVSDQSRQGAAQNALPFILDTDRVYERREPRYNDEVYYCFQCGPLTLLRRRRDGYFAIRPVRIVSCSFRMYVTGAHSFVPQLLRLLVLLYGPTPSFDTARELQDLSDEADVAEDLVQGKTAHPP